MKDYMHDIEFLRALDNDRNKIIYAKVISLTRDEQPIEAIEGVVQSGSINIDGSSAVRRSCNLTMTTKKLNINEIYWGFTTKIKLEIGLQNHINPSYDKIIWFKQGIYILTDFKTSSQVNNYTISLAGKDKMCLLNGDIGGHINAETNFGEVDIKNADGSTTTESIPIKDILNEMLHHYGQEPWANIIINNLEDYGLKMVDNNSENVFYLWRNVETGQYDYLTKSDGVIITKINDSNFEPETEIIPATSLPSEDGTFIFINGIEEDANNLTSRIEPSICSWNDIQYQIFRVGAYRPIGYQRTPLIYDKELIAAAGDTVTSVLDKIVQFLGPFEYFYNLDGQFVFQAKDTYLRTEWAADITLDTVHGISYVTPALMRQKIKYEFENGILLTAIQNNPNLLNVRNDYTIWGKKRDTNGGEYPIHARYAIDTKPLFYNTLDICDPNNDKKICSTAGQKYCEYNSTTNSWIVKETTNHENSGQGKHRLYATQEFVNELERIIKIPTAENYRVHPIPSVFGSTEAERNQWWRLEDWAEYYKAFKNDYPTGRIGDYSDANSIGFWGELHFSDNIVRSPVTGSSYQSAYAIVDIEHIIVDGVDKYYPTDVHCGWNGFQHRFHGCGHTYDQFLANAQRPGHENFESYFYQPSFDFDPTVNIHSENEQVQMATKFLSLLYAEKDAGLNPIVDWRELIYYMQLDWYHHNHDDTLELEIAKANRDISKALNRLDYYTGKTGYEQYYHDIEGFWRELYNGKYIGQSLGGTETINDLEIVYDSTGWNELVHKDTTQLRFWFDFYEPCTSMVGKFSIPAVGDRTKVVSDDNIRVIAYPDTPDIIYLTQEQMDDGFTLSSHNTGYSHLQLSEQYMIDNFSVTRRNKSIKETMDNLLYTHSHTNDNITLTTIPIYYLQPNSIIHVHDTVSNIDGYYEATKLTLPLTYNGTMNISAVKIPQQIY